MDKNQDKTNKVNKKQGDSDPYDSKYKVIKNDEYGRRKWKVDQSLIDEHKEKKDR